MSPKQNESVPKSSVQAFQAITTLTDDVCNRYLNDEYANLARRLAAALGRKRPSPILRGKPEIWACGIVYALGTVNFLFDQTQEPHIRADELCAAFGVNKSSGANKAKLIRDTFKMNQMDPNWCLPSMVGKNPLIWMLEVNGMIVDARHLPREIQVIAYEKGLIPYIYADQE